MTHVQSVPSQVGQAQAEFEAGLAGFIATQQARRLDATFGVLVERSQAQTPHWQSSQAQTPLLQLTHWQSVQPHAAFDGFVLEPAEASAMVNPNVEASRTAGIEESCMIISKQKCNLK